jgi:hypothetical protein
MIDFIILLIQSAISMMIAAQPALTLIQLIILNWAVDFSIVR